MNCRNKHRGERAERLILSVFMLFAVLILHTPQSSAQDFDRYRPNPVVPGRTIPELPEPPDNPVEGSTDQLVESLKGIMILDHETRVQDPIKPFDGIKVDPAADLTVATEARFREALQPYLGQPISIRMLNEMAKNIVLVYRDYGQPVVDVSMPPGQDITDGIVQVVVTESRIGEIRFRGNCYFDDCVLQQQSWLRPGQRIYEPCLQNELVWYNQHPFREVGVKLEPGSESGTTDIVYEVKEQRPIRWYMGYDDSGTRSTNYERLVFGVNFGNVWGKDRQLSYQYTADAYLTGTLGVHSVVYNVPIFENRDKWTVFASWADITSPVGNAPGFQNEGRAWQVSGRYTHTLCQTKSRNDSLHFGIDFKGTNSDLDFGGTSVFTSDVHVVQLMAGINSQQTYEDGQTLYGLDFFLSPGHLLTNNTSSAFNVVRPGARSSYMYARGYVERLYNVNCHSDFVVRGTAQLSDYKLLPTEQLGFGGFNTIRGYDMRFLNGDYGYIVNLEYRSKPIRRCYKGKETSLTVLGFTDFGQQFNHNTDISQRDQHFLASVGVGLRYLVNPTCTIRFDYGYPLTQVSRLPADSDGRIHLGAIVSY